VVRIDAVADDGDVTADPFEVGYCGERPYDRQLQNAEARASACALQRRVCGSVAELRSVILKARRLANDHAEQERAADARPPALANSSEDGSIGRMTIVAALSGSESRSTIETPASWAIQWEKSTAQRMALLSSATICGDPSEKLIEYA
jgi:hypothetical protein